jgi:TonB-linked SusC/RagA family outer membrane protein
MRKQDFLWLFLLLIGTLGYAQNVKVNGRVTTAGSEIPAIGISVTVKGTKNGTVTNDVGVFSLSAPKDATLVFSGIGFAPREMQVMEAFMEVVLEVKNENLNEVVVVGYGKQKRSNITAAIATVKGEDLIRRPVSNASMALQGMAPGVTVRQNSGQPGADGGTINIRGIGSINASSAPLIVVDGVEGVSLNDIDPNVIESISVLKDAASAAVYGARATNGVILVKTKRGQKGKSNVSFNSFMTLQQPTNMPKTLSAVDNMLLNNEAVANTGSTVLPYSQEIINLYRTTAPNNFTVFDTDWQDLIFQNTGLLQNHNIIISGGGDKASFLASGTFLDQQGLILNNSFRKFDLRLNGDVQITKTLKFVSDIFYTRATNNVPAGMAPTQIIQRGITMARNFPGKFEEGKYGDAGQSNSINPIAMAEASNMQTTETPTLSLQGGFRFEPIKNLVFDVTYNNRTSYTETVRPGRTYDVYAPNTSTGTLTYIAPIGDSSINYTTNRMEINQYYASVSYDWMIKRDHVFKAQAGFQARDDYFQTISATRFGLQYPDRPYLNLATGQQQPTVGQSANDQAVAGFFGRLNYSFKNTYLVEFTGRYDGSSRFSQLNDKQWGFFPGVSAGWVMSNEEFFRSIKSVNFFKLRASYGSLGNQQVPGGNYPFAALMNSGTAYYFDNELTRGFSLNNVQNVSLGWETSTQMNFGFDIGILNNKLYATVDYYEKRVNDMIINIPNPSYVGFANTVATIPTNAGSMVNKGWEFSTTWRDKIGSKFKYSITANLHDVTNKVTSTRGQRIVTGSGLIAEEGFPINSYLLFRTEGLYQEGDDFFSPFNPTRITGAGDIKYVDINKDGFINGDDRELMGNNFPRYEWSTDLTFSYGSFDLNTFLYGVGKRDNLISGVGVEPFNAGNWIASGLSTALERWTPENTNAAYPRLYSGGNGNYVASDFWLRNGAFWRIKHITLGYNLHKNLLKKMKMEQFRVYGSIVNAFTRSNYEPGFDPEISNTNGAFYPIMRTFTAGFNIRF